MRIGRMGLVVLVIPAMMAYADEPEPTAIEPIGYEDADRDGVNDLFADANGDGVNDVTEKPYPHHFQFIDKDEDKVNDIFVDRDGDGVNDLDGQFVDRDEDHICDAQTRCSVQ